MREHRRHPAGRRVAVAASAVAALAVGATVSASVPEADGTFHGCVNQSTGTLRVIDPATGGRTGTCATTGPTVHRETPISWSAQGPAGPPGAPGQPGPPGPPGPSAAYYTSADDQVPIAQSGETTVATLSDLPPGSYILQAHTTAVNPDVDDWTAVRCAIRAAGESSFGTWGSAAAVGLAGPASWFAQAHMSLPVVSDEAFAAELYCVQTRAATEAYVESSRLFAIALGSVVEQ